MKFILKFFLFFLLVSVLVAMGVIGWIVLFVAVGLWILLSLKRTNRNKRIVWKTYKINNPNKLFCENEDVISGMEFSATMQLRTPLEYLERHGDVFTDPKDFPDIDRSHGCLVPKLKSWKELGINLKESPEGSMASDIGPIPTSGGKYLEFLKDFRRIVESDMLPEERMRQILALRNINDDYAEIMDMHDDLRDGKLDKWCGYEKSLGLLGFDPRLSRNLWEAGFRSRNDIKQAANKQLMSVPGIGKAKTVKLKQLVNEL